MTKREQTDMQPIAGLREALRAIDPTDAAAFLAFERAHAEDARSGVRALARTALRKASALQAEEARLEAMRLYERRLTDEGYALLCGIDEVGRGPLAGPVCAGAVILPPDCRLLYLNDSKQLSEKRRETLYDAIMRTAVAAEVCCVAAERIDEINILQATYEAMAGAVSKLSISPDAFLIDAVHVPQLAGHRQESIVKGDEKSVSIAAASVVAKVFRDRLMKSYDARYPMYGFARNKGYGSAEHIAALKKYGPCPLHRRFFIGHFIQESI